VAIATAVVVAAGMTTAAAPPPVTSAAAPRATRRLDVHFLIRAAPATAAKKPRQTTRAALGTGQCSSRVSEWTIDSPDPSDEPVGLAKLFDRTVDRMPLLDEIDYQLWRMIQTTTTPMQGYSACRWDGAYWECKVARQT